MAFQIVRNDITKIKADAIVNTANPEPTYMAGTDAAIYEAAGAEELLKERKKAGIINAGEVLATPAFNLDAKYIFHTVGPIWEGGNNGEKETVRKCYENCLKKAVELGIGSIAFPLISTGVYGFPKTDVLLIATGVFSEFLAEHELDITLAVFDNESFELSGKIFAGVDEYIDEHYVEEKTVEEYGFADALEDVEPERDSGIRHRLKGIRGKRSYMREDAAASAAPIFEDAEAAPVPPPASATACAAKIPAPDKNLPLSASNAFMGGEGMAMSAAKAPKQRSLDDVVKNLTETWSESLLRMIDEKGYTDVEVYKRANVDRKHFSKIRTDKNYLPKKKTALAFALALKLNIDEAKDFLGRAGYAFSPSSKTDLIVQYFIENEVYEIMTINLALCQHNEPLLG